MKNISLVLSGGGARGAYQIGFWAALKDLGLDDKVSVITGSSIGAINGALMVQNDFDKTVATWQSVKPAMMFNVFEENARNKNIHAWRLYYELWKDRRKHGGIRFDPGKALLRQLINETTIRKSSVKLGVTAYNVDKRQGKNWFDDQIPEGKLAEYVIASATFPLFQPHVIDNYRYLDGGMYDNFPIKPALDIAPDNLIICVNISMAGAAAANWLRRKFQGANLEILYPNKSLGSPLHFSPKTMEKNIHLGYQDTLRFFKQKDLSALISES